MCGINGLIYKTTTSGVAEQIATMNEQIIHRGPDDRGTYVYESRIALGMQRLSIIDVQHGHQPMYNKDRTIIIVFNGEIYNFKELRSELEAAGHVFETSSDTEVIIHLYEKYGVQCFERLNGMFALAIHDVKKKIVTLARDRFGEKPLYYFETSECIGWASELKSLVPNFPFKKEICADALNLFLNLTYIPAPFCIYKNVFKLEAGCYKQIDTETFASRTIKYWDSKTDEPEVISSYTVAKSALRKLLIESVEKRMIADVPLGVFLSGGIDSTIIAAIMAEVSDKPVKTFSIGFADKKYDESERATQVARHIGAEHHQYQLNYAELIDEVDKIILNYDEPFADSSCLPTWFVSKKTSAHVKVALTGDGGDEVFGGYNKYLLHSYGRTYQKIVPRVVDKKIVRPFINSKFWPAGNSRSTSAKIKKLLTVAGNDAVTNHLELLALGFRQHELQGLLNMPVNLQPMLDHYLTGTKASALKTARYLDQHISLEGDMLAKVDRASMLCSLECRAPFLDHRLMEFTNRLPDDFLIQGNNKKRILKDSFADLLPKGFMRAPKTGFEIPTGEWFRNELKEKMQKTLSKEGLEKHGLFNRTVVEQLINDHLGKRADHSFKLWTIYCFQKWYDQQY
jgi:asparagine synthase (glutamine-hydrolysing)